MALDTLSTNFVDFINYTFSAFSIMLLTTGMFLSYPFLRGEIEDEEKNEKEAMAFTIGFVISIFMTMICVLGYARDNGDETYVFLMLIILLVNFSVIAWIGGLITRFWGNKIFIKKDKVEEI